MQKLKPQIEQKILKHALALFYEKGYEETTMRRIAAKSHITVGNIYRYFKNKEILFDKVIIEAYTGIVNIVNGAANLHIDLLMSSEYLNEVITRFTTLCKQFPQEIVIFLTRYLETGDYPLFTQFELIVRATLLAASPTLDATTTKLLTYLLLQGVLFTLREGDKKNIKTEFQILFNILFRDSRSVTL